jgi:hypothetical protein
VVAYSRAAGRARRADLTAVGQGPNPGRVGTQYAASLRPLNQPRPINVEADASGTPIAVQRRAVDAVIETWRIEDEWWRPQPVSRAYWRLLLEDGRAVDVYRDVLRDRWYRQAYAG